MKNNIIYLVTDGCYSDYRVLGAFSDKNKAEYAKMLMMADNDIEEYELDYIPDHPKGHLLYYVAMNDMSGDVKECGQTPIGYNEWTWQPSCYNDDDDMYHTYIMWATDTKHAIKIANERRTHLIAYNIIPYTSKEWQGKYNHVLF